MQTFSTLQEGVQHHQATSKASLITLHWPTSKHEWFRYTSVSDLKGQTLENPTWKHPSFISLKDLMKQPASDASKKLTAVLASLPDEIEQDVFAVSALSRIEEAQVLLVGKNFSSPPIDLSSAGHSLLFVLVESGAKVEIVIKRKGGPEFVSPFELWHLAEGSDVKITLLEDHGSSVRCIERKIRVLEESAHLLELKVQSGGMKSQAVNWIDLRGKYSSYELRLASSTSNNQQYDGLYCVRHSSPDTTSKIHVCSVANDQSRTVFNGKVEIPKNSVRSVADQRNRNMLLSNRAEIDSAPKLEIACDDVKCSHGASVTSINDEQLYYFQTRGVSREEASQLIVSGFVEPVLEDVTDDALRQEMRASFLSQVFPSKKSTWGEE